MKTALSSGSIEALKWLALAAMVVDHVAAVFYGRDVPMLVELVGRIAFPLFAVVLGYNMARPGIDLGRLLKRLLLFGAVATPAHAYLFAQAGGWWPLNVLLTFAAAVGVVVAIERDRPELAAAVFVIGGALVEYWWPGVGLVVVSWMGFSAKRRPRVFLVPFAICMAALCVVNGNAWAVLAVPLVLVAQRWPLRLPRLRWAFWVAYPAHLAAFAAAIYL